MRLYKSLTPRIVKKLYTRTKKRHPLNKLKFYNFYLINKVPVFRRYFNAPKQVYGSSLYSFLLGIRKRFFIYTTVYRYGYSSRIRRVWWSTKFGSTHRSRRKARTALQKKKPHFVLGFGLRALFFSYYGAAPLIYLNTSICVYYLLFLVSTKYAMLGAFIFYSYKWCYCFMFYGYSALFMYLVFFWYCLVLRLRFLSYKQHLICKRVSKVNVFYWASQVFISLSRLSYFSYKNALVNFRTFFIPKSISGLKPVDGVNLDFNNDVQLYSRRLRYLVRNRRKYSRYFTGLYAFSSKKGCLFWRSLWFKYIKFMRIEYKFLHFRSRVNFLANTNQLLGLYYDHLTYLIKVRYNHYRRRFKKGFFLKPLRSYKFSPSFLYNKKLLIVPKKTLKLIESTAGSFDLFGSNLTSQYEVYNWFYRHLPARKQYFFLSRVFFQFYFKFRKFYCFFIHHSRPLLMKRALFGFFAFSVFNQRRRYFIYARRVSRTKRLLGLQRYFMPAHEINFRTNQVCFVPSTINDSTTYVSLLNNFAFNLLFQYFYKHN